MAVQALRYYNGTLEYQNENETWIPVPNISSRTGPLIIPQMLPVDRRKRTAGHLTELMRKGIDAVVKTKKQNDAAASELSGWVVQLLVL